MSSTPRVRGWAALTALLLTAACTSTDKPATDRKNLPYMDAQRPVAERVADLLGRMDLTDKIGQMTQAERAAVTNADITTYALGSLLSGGGSAPSPNNATSWANMYDGFQNAAINSRLGIPLIYGVDAVHGHNNVVGATIFPHNIGLGATRDPALVQQIGRATAEIGKFDSTAWVGDIDVPTAVVVPTKDLIIPPRRQRWLARQIAGAATYEVDCGHSSCVMNAGPFTEGLLAASSSVLARVRR